jgi:adenine phosphoribosyltransferase
MPDIKLSDFIRDIPDFPKPGILFKDITPLLKDAQAFKKTIHLIAREFKGQKIDYVAGIESRGFIFGVALAAEMGVGFVPVRKKGKLPYKTKQVTYDLEYGQDTLEIHQDAFIKGNKVLIVDDLLATGGTAAATVKLVEDCGAEVVAFACVVELAFLNGREKLKDVSVVSLIKY